MVDSENVISMADYKTDAVKPKSEARRYKGHAFTLLFNPNAEETFRWGWKVKYTRVYEFSGSEPTIERAAKSAQRKIDAMEGRSERVAS